MHMEEEDVSHVECYPDDHVECYPDGNNKLNDENHIWREDSVAANDNYLGIEAEDYQASKNASENSLHNVECGVLKKLDSFGRWMDKEIGRDGDDLLMASDSCNYWNLLGTSNDDKEVSSMARHMQVGVDSVGPSLSQEQLFSILDFSPDWAYSDSETKVLIAGMFLGGVEHLSSMKWCCMFGEVEVSAEVLGTSVLRCQAPMHAPGWVSFYVTCSNRLACSEVREFEYREKRPGSMFSVAVESDDVDLMRFLIHLAKMLFTGADRRWPDCSVDMCKKCGLRNGILSTRSNDGSDWGMVEKVLMSLDRNSENPTDALIQKLLKDRLYEWLVCKVHEEGKGPNILDGEGLGVIHLAAALGYEWAMHPIAAAGVSPNFRDACGRTGLHWAAYFGREETVVTLVKLGVAPSALEDPTTKFPQGRTAADLASSRGHKGIAGYLAEADLTSQLSSLVLEESVMGSVSASLAVDKAIETAKEQRRDNADQLSFRGSLAALRTSARATAEIQDAFRTASFRQSHSNLAHVRGHQLHKQYKKVVWSVGIVEKAILRWRQKRKGLRGFRANGGLRNDGMERENADEYDFLHIGRQQKMASVEKALARVYSMVHSQEATQQYMRLVAHAKGSKMGYDGNTSCKTSEDDNVDENMLVSFAD